MGERRHVQVTRDHRRKRFQLQLKGQQAVPAAAALLQPDDEMHRAVPATGRDLVPQRVIVTPCPHVPQRVIVTPCPHGREGKGA